MSTADSVSRDQTHILIAEDSPTQAEKLRYTLERGGFRVTASANGRQALEQARGIKPAMVISDIVMPEMDGYELCRRLKSDPDLQGIPVILVTTLSEPQDVIRSLECSADGFVVKPYEDDYLLSRVDFVLLNKISSPPDSPGAGVEIHFDGRRHLITADRQQILNLLLSTYDAAIQRNKELSRTKNALRDANTALEATNKELESFSYSVSHDLRAPLRAIEGFSQSLMEDCGDQLDAGAKDMLLRMQNASQRMKQLIEDILNLSRIGRGELRRERVDLSALAEAVAAELRTLDPQRSVAIKITPGLFAQGDTRLIRVVFDNLMGNAWKFTSKTENSMIEVGVTPQGAAPAFFVRDNGAGFEMAYAQRLFGAFQRLHSSSEFPGTGIGLATVQRVIHRHGGRIWAESRPGVGTTFYFVL